MQGPTAPGDLQHCHHPTQLRSADPCSQAIAQCQAQSSSRCKDGEGGYLSPAPAQGQEGGAGGQHVPAGCWDRSRDRGSPHRTRAELQTVQNRIHQSCRAAWTQAQGHSPADRAASVSPSTPPASPSCLGPGTMPPAPTPSVKSSPVVIPSTSSPPGEAVASGQDQTGLILGGGGLSSPGKKLPPCFPLRDPRLPDRETSYGEGRKEPRAQSHLQPQGPAPGCRDLGAASLALLYFQQNQNH